MTDIFRNVTPEELAHAQRWFDHLRTPEKERVAKTIDVVNATQFCLQEYEQRNVEPVALIVAGSSIDTNIYTDIDLFVLNKNSLGDTAYTQSGFGIHYKRNTHPGSAFKLQIDGKLPEYVYVGRYHDHLLQRAGVDKAKLVAEGKGAIVTMSLFYQLSRFDIVREGKKDDLIEPRDPYLGAEEIIAYNRCRCAKFLVLSRQYDPAEKIE